MVSGTLSSPSSGVPPAPLYNFSTNYREQYHKLLQNDWRTYYL